MLLILFFIFIKDFLGLGFETFLYFLFFLLFICKVLLFFLVFCFFCYIFSMRLDTFLFSIPFFIIFVLGVKMYYIFFLSELSFFLFLFFFYFFYFRYFGFIFLMLEEFPFNFIFFCNKDDGKPKDKGSSFEDFQLGMPKFLFNFYLKLFTRIYQDEKKWKLYLDFLKRFENLLSKNISLSDEEFRFFLVSLINFCLDNHIFFRSDFVNCRPVFICFFNFLNYRMLVDIYGKRRVRALYRRAWKLNHKKISLRKKFFLLKLKKNKKNS